MTIITLLYLASFWLPLLGLVGLAAWRGGGPERFAAFTLLVGAALSWLAVQHRGQAFIRFEGVLALVDVTALAVFLFLALFAQRWWPLCIAAFQLVACLAHLTKFLDPGFGAGAYSQMESALSRPTFLTISAGTYLHARRTRRDGADPSWNRSLPSAARVILGVRSR